MTHPFVVTNERRGGRRIAAQLKVSLTNLGTGQKSLKEISRDISGGGMFVDTALSLASGDFVEVEIDVAEPVMEPLRLQAEVMRVEEGTGVGLRFIDVTPETLFQLAYLLRKLERVSS